MRALAIGLIAATLFVSLPNPALAVSHTKHHRKHTVSAHHHHWFWQHWRLHHHKAKSKQPKR
jgi:hypothetical protein